MVAVVPTHVIGPIITSYLIDRPRGLPVCGIPCPGPEDLRCMSSLFEDAEWFCQCDGNGFCVLSRDLGRRRARRCSCRHGCNDKPEANWEKSAWTVMRVLKLRSRAASAPIQMMLRLHQPIGCISPSAESAPSEANPCKVLEEPVVGHNISLREA